MYGASYEGTHWIGTYIVDYLVSRQRRPAMIDQRPDRICTPSVSPDVDKCAAGRRLKVSQKAPEILGKNVVVFRPLGISQQLFITGGVAVMNRRSFFGMLAGGAVAFPIAPLLTHVQRLNRSATAMSDAHGKISVTHYTSAAFAPLVGQVFSFHRTADASDPAIRLELVEVQPSAHRAMAGARQSFSLLFALRSADATEESTLHLRHDGFERCAWFVNRVTALKRDPRTPYYEAVFG